MRAATIEALVLGACAFFFSPYCAIPPGRRESLHIQCRWAAGDAEIIGVTAMHWKDPETGRVAKSGRHSCILCALES